MNVVKRLTGYYIPYNINENDMILIYDMMILIMFPLEIL